MGLGRRRVDGVLDGRAGVVYGHLAVDEVDFHPENGNMQLYGSVIKAPGKPFQMWYSVIHKPWRMYLAYAESDDGTAAFIFRASAGTAFGVTVMPSRRRCRPSRILSIGTFRLLSTRA